MSVGGVVGFGELESGIIDGCKNSGTLSAGTSGVSPYGGRYVRLAGICAQNNQHVSNVSNSGNFDVSRVENSPTLTTLEVGGCIGSTTADIAGDHNIVNTGIITTTLNVSGTVYTAFGGVVGNAEASVSGVENRGTVSIEPRATVINLNAGGVVGRVSSSTSVSVADVVNYGNVQFDYTSKKGEVPGHTDIHMGGIIGASENTPLTVSNAVNYGRVDKNNDVKATGKSLYVGGIAGYLANAKVSVADSHNYGTTYNGHWSNTLALTGSVYVGGIVACAVGASEAETVDITGCSNEVAVEDDAAATDGIYAKRGYAGGIVGYAKYVKVENCLNTTDFTTGNIAGFDGGIAGYLESSSVTGSIKYRNHTCNIDSGSMFGWYSRLY